jgi:RHS repeat-associated protein
MVSPVHGDYRRCQAEIPLIVLCRFPGPALTSSISGATTTATTTVYVWNGDTLIATIDQVTINGVNSGTSSTRYIHPDHLGSTNLVTDESGNIVQDSETYPYGETRLNQKTYPTNENRRFIGQFTDANSLQYLNARYLNSQQGQFLSEDPVFLGDSSQQNLKDPQSLNSYSYSDDNPITKSDPSGRCGTVCVVGSAAYVGAIAWDQGTDVYQNLRDPSVPWYSVLTPRGDDAALRYNRDAWSSVAVAESALAGEELVGPAVAET